MFWYYRRLDSGLVVMHARPEHADELEELQRVCFPTLADEERFKARHYRKHVELFADGQFVALDGERVVGATSTIRLPFDFAHVDHTFGEIIQGGWLTSHEPDGDWLYGADIGVHPAYRGRGLGAGALRRAPGSWCGASACAGQVTGGMLRGYGAVKDTVHGRGLLRRRRRRAAQGSDPVDAARRRLRAAGAAQGLLERSGLGQLQRAPRARRGEGRAGRVA